MLRSFLRGLWLGASYASVGAAAYMVGAIIEDHWHGKHLDDPVRRRAHLREQRREARGQGWPC